MGLPELLASLSLQPSWVTASMGTPVTFSIVPDISTARITEIRMVDVDFELLAKGFVFPNADPNDATTTAPLQVQDLVSDPPAVIPGVPGLLGRIRGQMPVAVPSDVAPTLQVSWEVKDGDGNDLLASGGAVAVGGLGGTTATLLFLPEAVELRNHDDPGVSPCQVHARVNMVHANSVVGSVSLSALVRVPKLALPTMLALFRDRHYTGPMLVAVPRETAIANVGELTGVVHGLVSSLAGYAGTRLGFLHATLAHLASRLTTQSGIAFRKGDGITELDDITLSGGFFNDTEAEDELSSLVLFSRRGRKAELFNDRRYAAGEGAFVLQTGPELVAGVRDLHHATPSCEPAGASVSVTKYPPGGYWDPDTFGDELSSLRFVSLPAVDPT